MRPRAMLLVILVLLLGTGTAWARGFGGAMGATRSSGTGGQTTIVHSSTGQIQQSQQVVRSGRQVIIQSGAASHIGRPFVASVPRFVTRVAAVPVFIPHPPGHFNHFPFVSHPGVLIIDVPQVEVTTVTTQFLPTDGWPQPWNENSPADSRLRGSGQLAPFDPTSLEVAERMLALAGVRKGDVVYDLGSGDGRMVIAAAKKYGVRAVGFEIDPGLVKLARENVRKQGVEKLVEIRQQNFMTADLSPATVVTLYLSYDGNLALRPRLMNQLKPGARVVSNTFDMGDWQAKIVESYRAATGDTHLLYYWEISGPELYGKNSNETPLPSKENGASRRLSFVATA